jgi:hypothetical protein
MRSRLWLLAIGAVLALVNVVPAFAESGGVIWGT